MNKKAIILENKITEFPEFFRNWADPLFIPFQNRHIIEWYLENLSLFGYESVIIMRNIFTDSAEKYVGNGNPWGLEVNFVYSGHNEKLVLKIITESGNYNKDDIYFLNDLSFNGKVNNPGLLNSTKNYKHFHLTSENTTPTNLSKQIAPGIYSGIRSTFYPQNMKGEQHIGNYVTLSKTSQLSGINWIGDYSVIDDSVMLKNTVILPGTYIGRNMVFENCLIFKNKIFDFKTGEEISIDDQLVLSETKNIYEEITPNIKQKNSFIDFELMK